MGRAMGRTRKTLNQFSPILSADIVESEHDYHVHVDLPGKLELTLDILNRRHSDVQKISIGVHPEDIEVTVLNGFLKIRAERRQVYHEDSKYRHHVERSFGKVERSVAIPENAVQERADTKFLHGVLTVQFPKREGTEVRKLAIHIE